MTDRDKIELPPLPGEYYTFSKGEVREYGRDCFMAGLAAARAEQASPAKPKVYSATLSLGQNGSWSCYPPSIHGECATVTLCWTDDGRAWIDSERNRELAESLRGLGFPASADALDGGVR